MHWEADQSKGQAYWYRSRPAAISVEMTAYVLQACICIADCQCARATAKWLNSARNSRGAFVSTQVRYKCTNCTDSHLSYCFFQDTVVALTALSQFAAGCRVTVLHPPNLCVDVKLMSKPDQTHKHFRITPENAQLTHHVKVTILALTSLLLFEVNFFIVVADPCQWNHQGRHLRKWSGKDNGNNKLHLLMPSFRWSVSVTVSVTAVCVTLGTLRVQCSCYWYWTVRLQHHGDSEWSASASFNSCWNQLLCQVREIELHLMCFLPFSSRASSRYLGSGCTTMAVAEVELPTGYEPCDHLENNGPDSKCLRDVSHFLVSHLIVNA